MDIKYRDIINVDIYIFLYISDTIQTIDMMDPLYYSEEIVFGVGL